MSTAELRAKQIFKECHLNNEDFEVKRNLMMLLLSDTSYAAQSIGREKNNEDSTPDLYTCFHGSWGEGTTTEEYCKQLREGISEPKEVEAW